MGPVGLRSKDNSDLGRFPSQDRPQLNKASVDFQTQKKKLVFETGSHVARQASLQFTVWLRMTLSDRPPNWDYRCTKHQPRAGKPLLPTTTAYARGRRLLLSFLLKPALTMQF